MAPQLSQIERERIVALRQSGCRIIDICRQTGITKKTVYFWLRRWHESGSLTAHHRQLYVRATTAAEDAAMVAAHSADPSLSTRTTSASYRISMDTVRRRLKDAARKCCRPAKKTVTAAAHKEARVEMDYDVGIEEHDVLDNPIIKTEFPDISVIKKEITQYFEEEPNIKDEPETEDALYHKPEDLYIELNIKDEPETEDALHHKPEDLYIELNIKDEPETEDELHHKPEDL